MALQLYRRHRKECKSGHSEDSKSGQFEEGRRGWKRCDCLIHASGTIAGKFGRRSTGEWDWNKAHDIADRWKAADTWPSDGQQPKPEPAPDATLVPSPARTTVR